MNRIIFSICVFLTCLLPDMADAQFTETKEINKRFAVNPETSIEITNKYGKVEINTWDKDSVVIEINIRVEEKKLSKLEKSMDEIDFDFTDSQHYLIVRTVIGENRSTLEKEFLKFKESILQSDGSMEIDYTVWLPKENNLKVENKFGNVFIGDYKGDVEINLSNGNLKSHDFYGKLDLTLNFADATINHLDQARLDCNYGNLIIEKAGEVRIVSKSSTFEIQEAIDVEAESRRDKFRIHLAELLDARGSFSTFRINKLTDRLTLRVDYSDIDIRETSADFGNILIESKSTDTNLYFSKSSTFGFEITHSKSETMFGDAIKITEEKVLDEKDNKIEIKGNFGDGNSAQPKLFINAVSGEINIFSE